MRRLAAALCAALALSACAPKRAVVQGGAPVRLAYGGAAGDSRSWTLEQTFRGRLMSMGIPQLVVIKARAVITERVEAVEENGWRRVAITTDLKPIEYNGMAVELGAVPSHIESRVMRSPSGEVNELEAGEARKDTLAWVARSLGSTFPILPPSVLVPGEQWRKDSVQDSPTGGVFRVATIGVLRGFEDAGGVKAAVLAMEGGIDLQDAPKGAELASFRLEYKGTTRFDPAAGRIIDSTQEGTLTVKGKMAKSPLEAILLFKSEMLPVK